MIDDILWDVAISAHTSIDATETKAFQVATADATSKGKQVDTKLQPKTQVFDVLLTIDQMLKDYEPYRVQPPLTRVWCGDDPVNPTKSIQLQFASVEEAKTVLSGKWKTA